MSTSILPNWSHFRAELWPLLRSSERWPTRPTCIDWSHKLCCADTSRRYSRVRTSDWLFRQDLISFFSGFSPVGSLFLIVAKLRWLLSLSRSSYGSRKVSITFLCHSYTLSGWQFSHLVKLFSDEQRFACAVVLRRVLAAMCMTFISCCLGYLMALSLFATLCVCHAVEDVRSFFHSFGVVLFQTSMLW